MGRRGVETIGRREQKQLGLSVNFYANLLPEAAVIYAARVPKKARQAHEKRQDGVMRMGGMVMKGLIDPKEATESNLQHYDASFGMALEYKRDYPVLENSVDWVLVQQFSGLHDTGEMCPIIADVPVTNRSHRDEARKRLEPKVAKRIIEEYIPDPEDQLYWLGLYDRYQANRPEDISVQMARFIDKAQGTTRVADKVFNIHAPGGDEKRGKIAEHLWLTVPRMLEPATNLMVHLPTVAERSAMKDILLGELKLLAQHGPPEVAETFKVYAA